LFREARREVIAGAGNVREIRVELDGPPLDVRSRLLISRGLSFVFGENTAAEDMTLRHEGREAVVGVHVTLVGDAVAKLDALERPLTARPGELQMFASPSSHSTVQLPAHVKNKAFRVSLDPELVCSLATRHVELEPLAAHVERGTPYCPEPMRSISVERALGRTTEIIDSEHYGALRPLFLECQALSWLALALAPRAPRDGRGLAAREVDRMHEAKDILAARIASPPTLAEVAAAVGTNEFALKRNFKSVFGEPVYRYLLGLRLAHSRQLLESTNDTIKEIASAVGYAHPNHFSTAFRRFYGLSPAEHRRARRG
jgi:AraC-like DNA-binding protein